MTRVIRSFLSRFQSALARRGSEFWTHRPAPAIDVGCETRTVPADYRWDGLRRGENRRHPRLLFQVTLDGWGAFEQDQHTWRVGPETGFLAVLPSAHVYHLPDRSPGWVFAWIIIDHPFVVLRVSELLRKHPAVLTIGAGSELMATTFELFERTCTRRFEDLFAEEAALLAWMIILQRHLHEQAHPRDVRTAMLAEVRAYTLENLRRSFGVAELAQQRGLARSHYCHQFRDATGLTPAACVLDVRLHEVRRLLRETDRPLKDVAVETGFADANHLCKAFRRQFHITPGVYRRQIG